MTVLSFFARTAQAEIPSTFGEAERYVQEHQQCPAGQKVMSLYTFNLACRGCGGKEPRNEWVAVHYCDGCLTTRGATDPHHVVGYWHGCLRTPDHSIASDAYWVGYAKALRVRSGRTPLYADRRTAIIREFPGVNADEALLKYESHKKNAAARGIEWGFDLLSWLRTWIDSGHWGGRRKGGYVMARKGDIGPYSAENVYITTSAQNVQDGWANRPVRVGSKRSLRFKATKGSPC